MSEPHPWGSLEIAFEEWIVVRALGEFDLATLFRGACEMLLDGGFPIVRTFLTMGSLHPMFETMSVTWSKGQGPSLEYYPFGSENEPRWQQSPLRPMLESDQQEARYPLTGSLPPEYPMLSEFAATGATDYFVRLESFSSPEQAKRTRDGVILTWTTEKEGGFSDTDLAAIRNFTALLALMAKIYKREQTVNNIVSAYLGPHVGQRVLDGQIRRGDADLISAVIWYSDLRRSTPLAEELGPEPFLAALNAYFECSAGAVQDHGGEVLRFVGDAVLGIFPVEGVDGPRRSCRMALAAAASARERLLKLNTARRDRGEPELDFGIGLHFGDVLFGNIGIPERVEFSVVGTTANEVARLEDLTKEAGEPVLVSQALADLVPRAWREVGTFTFRGVGLPQQVYAPL